MASKFTLIARSETFVLTESKFVLSVVFDMIQGTLFHNLGNLLKSLCSQYPFKQLLGGQAATRTGQHLLGEQRARHLLDPQNGYQL